MNAILNTFLEEEEKVGGTNKFFEILERKQTDNAIKKLSLATEKHFETFGNEAGTFSLVK